MRYVISSVFVSGVDSVADVSVGTWGKHQSANSEDLFTVKIYIWVNRSVTSSDTYLAFGVYH